MGKGYRYSYNRHTSFTDQDMAALHNLMREAIVLARPHRHKGKNEFGGEVFTHMRRMAAGCRSPQVKDLVCRDRRSFEHCLSGRSRRRKREVIKMFKYLMEDTSESPEDSLDMLEQALRGMQGSVLAAKSVAEESEKVRAVLDKIQDSLEDDINAAA